MKSEAAKPLLPARVAREKAGFTLEAAAARLHIKPATLRARERQGFPFYLAERAAQLYGAGLADFLRPSLPGAGSGKRRRAGGCRRSSGPTR